MMKSKEIKLKNARKLATLQVNCSHEHTTAIPMKFEKFIRPTGFLWKRTPLKAVYKCME